MGKMGLVGEQDVTNHMVVRVNPMAQFQPATYVHRFKMLNALMWYRCIPSACSVHQILTRGTQRRAEILCVL